MKSRYALLAGLSVLALQNPIAVSAADTAHQMQHQAKGGDAECTLLPKPGTRIPLPDGGSFIYSFEKTPKMGMTILKVEVFDAAGKKETSCQVNGNVDMPSMRGHHSSGPQPFKVSKKGDYLLPVNVVMPGEWEICFTFTKGGKVVLRGKHLFNV